MGGELIPALVEPRSASREFWTRFHEYRRLRHMETRPLDPIRPNDETEARMQRDDPFEIIYRYEIEQRGQMLSWFSGMTVRPGTPEFESNKHIFEAGWSVRAEFRRRGIGAAWLALVVELMDRHECKVLGVGVEEESGHAFLRWLGAVEKSAGAENRLDLAVVDWELVRRWIAEGARRSPKTRLEIYDGRLPEALWEEFTRQRALLLNGMPFDDLDHGDIVDTPDHLREQYAQMALGHEAHHVVLARADDGVIEGLTDLTWAPFRPTIAEQELTGVLPRARGRGIGKWIKAAMLAHLHEIYPDVRMIRTGNSASNAPMLAINKRLGFKQSMASSEYQIGRDQVAARATRGPRLSR